MATTDLFRVSLALPFPACHRFGIMQFYGLLSLSGMHLRFFLVFSWLDWHFFLALNNNGLEVPSFIHSLVILRDILVASKFYQLRINCYKHPNAVFFKCGHRFSSPLGKYLVVEVQRSNDKYMFKFLRNCQTILQSGCTIITLTPAKVWVLTVSHPCQYLIWPVFSLY